jgi:cellulose synthase/poly-beta-1,6-N-acetylglucosamine synthase-like glycosyltransferase
MEEFLKSPEEPPPAVGIDDPGRGAQVAYIGDALVAAGAIGQEQLDRAVELQKGWGSRLGDILLGMGWVRPLAFYKVLANHFQLEFVNLMKDPVDASLVEAGRVQDYAEGLYLPWKLEHGRLSVACADPASELLTAFRRVHPEARLVITSKFDILWELQRVAAAEFSRQAVYRLAERNPAHSASIVLTRKQKYAGIATLAFLILAAVAFPSVVAIGFNGLINSFLFGSFLFRTVLCLMSCGDESGFAVTQEEVDALEERELPVYTVLVPMYKEPAVLPILAAALRRMEYPRSKLDIKLVLEADDLETIDGAKALALEASFEIIRVPHSLPKTKPKACNYAIQFARGEYLTIYDAEDKPEPDQLKKAIVAFRKLGKNTACIQARLNYFNAEENWLTRMFTLEYSLWFDMFLPALDRLRVPIPLGGTSNHFDLAKLRDAGAWDPFNVTEDADLGLRFAAMGYRVGVVNSVTYEEANSHVGNWIRQRSRWMKGYMQTWLVNMRDPIGLIRRVGIKGFLSLHFFVGGGIMSGLGYPFMLIPFLLWLFTRTHALQVFFPVPVLAVSTLNLLAGNSFLIYLSMLAAAKRHDFSLLAPALTVPAYWLLMCIAAYKGLWQLVTRPFFWEKTTHGISKFTSAEILQAQPKECNP